MTSPLDRPRLLFCPAWFPNRFDPASGSFNERLARELSPHFDVSVLYVHVHEEADVGHCFDHEASGPVRILRAYAYRRRRWGPAFPFIYLRRFMEGYHELFGSGPPPDLAFVRGVLPGGFGAHRLRRRFGVPYVTIESFSGFAGEMRSPFKRWWTRRILEGASANAAVSSYQRDVMRGLFPGVNFDVVTNVIPVTEAQAGEPGDPARELRMIYVGNLVPVKGWDLLIEALRLELDAGSGKLRLTVVGDGPDEAGFRATVERLRLGEVVEFAGRRPHAEVKRLIANHHFLVLPSRVDTCPNVVLEAFMEGRPVLATRSGGAVDLVAEATGRLVEKESPEALREGIAWMREHLTEFDADAIRAHVIRNHSVGTLVAYLQGALKSKS